MRSGLLRGRGVHETQPSLCFPLVLLLYQAKLPKLVNNHQYKRRGGENPTCDYREKGHDRPIPIFGRVHVDQCSNQAGNGVEKSWSDENISLTYWG